MISATKPDQPKSWLDFLRFAVHHRRFICSFTLTCTILALAGSLFLSNKYEAKVTLLPLDGNRGSGLSDFLKSSSSAMILSNLLPGKGTLNTANNLAIILQSYTLSEKIIQKLQLQRELYPWSWDAIQKRWKWWAPQKPMDRLVKCFQDQILRVGNPRNGPLSINVEMHDPQLAATTANELVQELQLFINNNVLTVGKKHRLFMEKQLAENQVQLAAAEDTLKKFEDQYKVFSIENQTKLSLELYSALKSKMIENSVSLGEIERTYGRDNPSYQKMVIENQAIQRQINELEKENPQGKEKKKTILGALDKVPELKLEYLRLKRNALVLSKMFELLKEEYEIAKTEELRDEISFQVIDPAHAPQLKSSPHRTVIILCAFLLSALISLGLAYGHAYVWPQIFTAAKEAYGQNHGGR